ncbi:MAG: hypothetical protein AAFP85_19715 [Pseudomonadota bacterium]
MQNLRVAAGLVGILTLAACDVSTFSAQAYPDRTQYQFLTADRSMVHTYACLPSDSEARTKSRAARAHVYVDEGIQSAQRRFPVQPGLAGGLAARAEVNAEIAQISRQAEAEYRCILLNRKNA